jgi:hypothetical protein
VAPGRRKVGDNTSWGNANRTVPKMKRIHTVNSVVIIGREKLKTTVS